MYFRVQICCDGDAFADSPVGGVHYVLSRLIEGIDCGNIDDDNRSKVNLIDPYGNTVGFADWSEDPIVDENRKVIIRYAHPEVGDAFLALHPRLPGGAWLMGNRDGAEHAHRFDSEAEAKDYLSRYGYDLPPTKVTFERVPD